MEARYEQSAMTDLEDVTSNYAYLPEELLQVS